MRKLKRAIYPWLSRLNRIGELRAVLKLWWNDSACSLTDGRNHMRSYLVHSKPEYYSKELYRMVQEAREERRNEATD